MISLAAVLFFLNAHAQVSPAFEKSYVQAKEKIKDKESNQRDVLNSLYELDAKIRTLAKKRQTINDNVFGAEMKSKDLSRHIVDLEKQVAEQRRHLAKRLRAIYAMGSQGILRILFQAQTAGELDQNIRFLSRFSEIDKELIRGISAKLNEVKAKRNQLRESVEKYLALHKQLNLQEKDILVQQEAKSKILQKIRSEHRQQIRKLQALKSRIKDTNSVDWILAQESFFEKRGQLSWPILGGLVTQEFGLHQDPEFRFRVLNKGLFIKAESGSDVHAVSAGVVQFRGEFAGLGQVVIVDHGDQYFSVYAHLKNTKIKTGDSIAADAPIGEAGYSEMEKQPGVYFEIRHYSDPVDPRPWLKTAQHNPQQTAEGEREDEKVF